MIKRKVITILLTAVSLIQFLPLEGIRRRRSETRNYVATNFMLLSPAFPNGGVIPSLYTCDGDDISPPLRWKNVPTGTKSFAIIVEDPDARGGHWAHWVVWDLPNTMRHLSKAADIAYYGGVEGMNSWQTKGWGGPCPPIKKHRYIFTVYALKTDNLRISKNASRSDLLRAMHGKIIAKARLVGAYEKKLKKGLR